jgi:hypothetical protein
VLAVGVTGYAGRRRAPDDGGSPEKVDTATLLTCFGGGLRRPLVVDRTDGRHYLCGKGSGAWAAPASRLQCADAAMDVVSSREWPQLVLAGPVVWVIPSYTYVYER